MGQTNKTAKTLYEEAVELVEQAQTKLNEAADRAAVSEKNPAAGKQLDYTAETLGLWLDGDEHAEVKDELDD